MKAQITIIGLGRIGASVGLALASRKETLLRVGHDIDPQTARQAEKIGAVDRTHYNLPEAVRQANVVLLAVPLDQIRETLALIAPDLPENAVVMDTAPVKAAVMAWAKELLPVTTHYVGLTPAINPAYLHTAERGIAAAHADLFEKGLFVILTPPGVPGEAVKLAVDFTSLLGAHHLFADTLEADGLMAATHVMPQLLAAALVNATTPRPGWQEGRKVAGRAYAAVASPLESLEGAEALSAAALLTPQSVLRALDNAMQELQNLRQLIQNNDAQALTARLQTAAHAQQEWQRQRQAADWASEAEPTQPLPTTAEAFARFFGLLAQKPKRSK